MRRPDRVDLLFIAGAAVAALLLLGLGAGLTFFSDEWAFIESRALGDPTTWFAPHNEQWTTLPILVYRVLVETIGLGSYMPYLAILVGLHLVVAALVYVLVRRSSGPWLALAVSVVVLVLGGGFENLFWAFQIGFVGALAAGLAAILAFDAHPLTRRRAAIGTGLLVVSLATHGGPGLVCCAAVAVELVLDPPRRRMAVLLAIPAGVYGAWYLAVGRVGVEAHQGVFRLGGLADMPPMILAGFSAVVGTVVGADDSVGSLVLALVVGASAILVLRRGHVVVAPRFIASVVAVAMFYGLIALARSFAGLHTATLTRYTYLSTILMIVGICEQLGRPSVPTPLLRRAWLVVGGLVLTLSLIWNVRLLIAGRTLFAERAERTRALITVALERPLPATTDPDRTLVLVPSPNEVARIVGAYGSPLNDSLVPWAVPPIRAEVLAAAQRVLEEGAEIPLPSPDAP